jgi:hypothetical protein
MSEGHLGLAATYVGAGPVEASEASEAPVVAGAYVPLDRATAVAAPIVMVRTLLISTSSGTFGWRRDARFSDYPGPGKCVTVQKRMGHR